MISYSPLWETMKSKGVSTYTLREKMGFSPGTLTQLKNNRHVSTHTLDILCNLLDCDIEKVVLQIRDREDDNPAPTPSE